MIRFTVYDGVPKQFSLWEMVRASILLWSFHSWYNSYNKNQQNFKNHWKNLLRNNFGRKYMKISTYGCFGRMACNKLMRLISGMGAGIVKSIERPNRGDLLWRVLEHCCRRTASCRSFDSKLAFSASWMLPVADVIVFAQPHQWNVDDVGKENQTKFDNGDYFRNSFWSG